MAKLSVKLSGFFLHAEGDPEAIRETMKTVFDSFITGVCGAATPAAAIEAAPAAVAIATETKPAAKSERDPGDGAAEREKLQQRLVDPELKADITKFLQDNRSGRAAVIAEHLGVRLDEVETVLQNDPAFQRRGPGYWSLVGA